MKSIILLITVKVFNFYFLDNFYERTAELNADPLRHELPFCFENKILKILSTIVDYLVTLLTNNDDNNNNNNNKVKLARIKKWFLYRPKFAHQNQRMDLFPGETRLDQAEASLKKTLTFGVQVRWGAGGREC